MYYVTDLLFNFTVLEALSAEKPKKETNKCRMTNWNQIQKRKNDPAVSTYIKIVTETGYSQGYKCH